MFAPLVWFWQLFTVVCRVLGRFFCSDCAQQSQCVSCSVVAALSDGVDQLQDLQCVQLLMVGALCPALVCVVILGKGSFFECL